MLKIIENTTGREAALGLSVRVAGASYGRPVCIEPEDKRDESLSVSLYVHEGSIVGVVVLDTLHEGREADDPMIHRIGLVPGETTEDAE